MAVKPAVYIGGGLGLLVGGPLGAVIGVTVGGMFGSRSPAVGVTAGGTATATEQAAVADTVAITATEQAAVADTVAITAAAPAQVVVAPSAVIVVDQQTLQQQLQEQATVNKAADAGINVVATPDGVIPNSIAGMHKTLLAYGDQYYSALSASILAANKYLASLSAADAKQALIAGTVAAKGLTQAAASAGNAILPGAGIVIAGIMNAAAGPITEVLSSFFSKSAAELDQQVILAQLAYTDPALARKVGDGSSGAIAALSPTDYAAYQKAWSAYYLAHGSGTKVINVGGGTVTIGANAPVDDQSGSELILDDNGNSVYETTAERNLRLSQEGYDPSTGGGGQHRGAGGSGNP